MAMASKFGDGDYSSFHKDVFVHNLFYEYDDREGRATSSKLRNELLEGVLNGFITMELNEKDSLYKIVAFRKTNKFEQLLLDTSDSGRSTLRGLHDECLKELEIKSKREFIEGTKELLARFDQEAKSSSAKNNIAELTRSLVELAVEITQGKCEAHLFGSRKTGLAKKKSDIDIFLDVGGKFHGSISEDKKKQESLVKSFAKKMQLGEGDFVVPKDGIRTSARVPILSFKHCATELNCDLSFRSGMSTKNSELVKFYLDMDPRVKFVVAGIRYWFDEIELAGKDEFTSYAQVWLVFFFLMKAEVIPTLSVLKSIVPTKPVMIEGWDCSVPRIEDVRRSWHSPCSFSREELLMKFFMFYRSQPVRKSLVLCPITGEILRRRVLYRDEKWLSRFSGCIKKAGGIEAFTQKVRAEFDGFCVQDPFDLMKNLTRNIGKKFKARMMVNFVAKCDQTTRLS